MALEQFHFTESQQMFQLAARIICVAVAQLGEDKRYQNNEKQGGSKDFQLCPSSGVRNEQRSDAADERDQAL